MGLDLRFQLDDAGGDLDQPQPEGVELGNPPSIGLVRNACYLQLLCTAINLKRALTLAG